MKRATLMLSGLALTVLATAALAQDWPSRPVRMLINASPGGPTDNFGRVFAQKLAELLKQPMVAENRPGAGGVVATEAVARSPADGYTLLFTGSGPMVTTPHLTPKLPYEPFRDLAPVALCAIVPTLMITGPNSGVHSVQDLIAQAKAQPGKLNYATVGIGTVPHLAAELLRARAGIDIVHVPYKGVPLAEAAVMTGEVAFLFTQLAAINLARAGKVRALAVSSAKRSALVPELPSLSESGIPGFDVIAWYGILLPAKTPEGIATRLNAELMRALAQKDFADRLQSLGAESPASHTPAEFLVYMRRESDKWQKVIRDAGIQAN